MNDAASMKRKRNKFSQFYRIALRKHLKHGADAQLQAALEMGREAVALGVQTLEMAQIHERALATMKLPADQHGLIQKAELFFNEAITAIVETHRGSRQGQRDLNQLNEKLGRCTAEMAGTKRQLERGTIRRKSAEAALKTNGEHYSGLLKVSLQLQNGLRQLAHRSLSSLEKERKGISHQLQDDIGQTLLAINVRLLILKTAARGNTAKLRKEIISTQRLVEESIQSVTRYARELNPGHA